MQRLQCGYNVCLGLEYTAWFLFWTNFRDLGITWWLCKLLRKTGHQIWGLSSHTTRISGDSENNKFMQKHIARKSVTNENDICSKKWLKISNMFDFLRLDGKLIWTDWLSFWQLALIHPDCESVQKSEQNKWCSEFQPLAS